MANIPDDRKYTREHEWVLLSGQQATVGVTDFAQKQLGDVVFVELPTPGDEFAAGEPLGSVESVKAVSEVYMPVAGTVVECNENLSAGPELLNDDPYGDGWLIQVAVTDSSAADGLLSAEEYAEYVAESAE